MKRYVRSARGNITKLDELDTSQFNKDQLSEIKIGLEKGVDVSQYADPEFDWTQMAQIREGLEKGLDVSQYTDPEFDWSQMMQIRFGLEEGLDVNQYADPKFTFEQMKDIRRRLLRESDLDSIRDRLDRLPVSTKSNSSRNFNWPDPSYWDEIEFDDDMEDAWEEYLSGPEGEVESELQLYFEPSIQGGQGGMFIFDESGEDRFEPIEEDYALWCDTELELASESSSAEEYKQKFKDYVLNLIG